MLTLGGGVLALVATTAGAVVAFGIGADDRTGSIPGRVRLIGDGEALTFTPATAISLAPDAERELLTLLNNSRAQFGIPELALDPRLAALARTRSRDMYRRGYFAHADPQGLTFFDRLRSDGIPYTKAAENLAIAPTAQEAHDQALASSTHREKMLDTGFCRIGIGVYAGPQGLLVTELFLTWRPYGTRPSTGC